MYSGRLRRSDRYPCSGARAACRRWTHHCAAAISPAPRGLLAVRDGCCRRAGAYVEQQVAVLAHHVGEKANQIIRFLIFVGAFELIVAEGMADSTAGLPLGRRDLIEVAYSGLRSTVGDLELFATRRAPDHLHQDHSPPKPAEEEPGGCIQRSLTTLQAYGCRSAPKAWVGRSRGIANVAPQDQDRTAR